jgi:hypothetical protein
LCVYKVKIELAQKSEPNPIKTSLKTKPMKILKNPKKDKT